MEDHLSNTGLKVVFWNIRSTLNKIGSIRIKMHDMHISILAITESWLKSDIPDTLIDIEGFISPPNVYMRHTCLVPGRTGGYNARWC